MSEKTYNGWSNYETWNVKLWMDNEVGSYEYWNERAQELWEYPPASTSLSNSEAARYALADELKSQYEDAMADVLPKELQSSVWADLLGAALSEVNWNEIANAILENKDLSDDETGEKYEPYHISE